MFLVLLCSALVIISLFSITLWFGPSFSQANMILSIDNMILPLFWPLSKGTILFYWLGAQSRWLVNSKSKIMKLRKIRIKSQLHYNVGARTQIPIFLIQSAGSNSTIIEAKQLHRRQSTRGIELEFSVCCPSSLPFFFPGQKNYRHTWAYWSVG